MTEIAKRDTDGWVEVAGDVFKLAGQLAKTAFVPKAMQGNPAAVAAAILTGREMGLGPMGSLAGIDVIEGRPSLSSQLLLQLVFAAGHHVEWVAADDKKATVRITRGDGRSTAEVTYTLADAQRAGLTGKKVWQQHPAAMLRHRAVSACVQMVCPDVALGVGAADADADSPPAAPAQVRTVRLDTTPPPPEVEVVEVIAEVEEVEAAEVGGLATDKQLRMIHTLITKEQADHEIRMTRDEIRHMIAGLAGVDPDQLESSKQLTREQATAVIDALRERETR